MPHKQNRAGKHGSVYVSGPMTGLPGHNMAAFDRAAELLRAHGWAVYSPASNDRAAGFDGSETPTGAALAALWRWDLARIAECDAIFLLKGWERSDGARLELAAAQHAGLQVMYARGAVRCPGRILTTAVRPVAA